MKKVKIKKNELILIEPNRQKTSLRLMIVLMFTLLMTTDCHETRP